MTQEIYNYLLTREKFIISSLDELIQETYEKDNFKETIQTIHDIMYRENIFLLNEEYYRKIAKYLQEFRFSYISDKEINPVMNEVISALAAYDAISMEEKRNYITSWMVKEIADRNFTNSWIINFVGINELLDFVLSDSTYLKQLSEKNVNIENPRKVLATLSVICWQFFKVYEEDKDAFQLSLGVASTIQNTTKDRKIKKMAKEYIKHVTYRMDNHLEEKIKKKEL